MEFEKLNRRPWGKGRGKKFQTEREANHKRLLNTENKLKVDGGEGKWVMRIEEGTCWDEHWMLYVSQFHNKLYSYKKKRSLVSEYATQEVGIQTSHEARTHEKLSLSEGG